MLANVGVMLPSVLLWSSCCLSCQLNRFFMLKIQTVALPSAPVVILRPCRSHQTWHKSCPLFTVRRNSSESSSKVPHADSPKASRHRISTALPPSCPQSIMICSQSGGRSSTVVLGLPTGRFSIHQLYTITQKKRLPGGSQVRLMIRTPGKCIHLCCQWPAENLGRPSGVCKQRGREDLQHVCCLLRYYSATRTVRATASPITNTPGCTIHAV